MDTIYFLFSHKDSNKPYMSNQIKIDNSTLWKITPKVVVYDVLSHSCRLEAIAEDHPKMVDHKNMVDHLHYKKRKNFIVNNSHNYSL